MSFSIDRTFVSCVIYDGTKIILESAIYRDVFQAQFNAPRLEKVIHMAVDTKRNIYHVIEDDSDNLIVSTPDDPHETIKFFIDNQADLEVWFLDAENQNKKPSDFHTYNYETHNWDITSENDFLWKAKQVRDERDILLAESDWTQGKDIKDEISSVWAVYRQELRDIPQQSGFPENVIYPQKPK